MFNNDGNYVDWDITDEEFAAQELQAFGVRLGKLCRDPAITQILVATHVPPFIENLERRPGDLASSFGNAYCGNLTLGRAIIRCPKVTHVVSAIPTVVACGRRRPPRPDRVARDRQRLRPAGLRYPRISLDRCVGPPHPLPLCLECELK